MDKESFFYKNFYKYFLWNKELVNYYFSNRGKDNIKLYVNEKILADIGRKINIEEYSNDSEYKEDFMESVEGFCNYYNKYDAYYKCPLPNLSKNLNNDKDRKEAVNCKSAIKDGRCRGVNTYKDKHCVEMTIAGDVDIDFVRPDFLAIAKHMADKHETNSGKIENGMIYYSQEEENKYKTKDGKVEKFDLPFFAIIVYIILRFDDGESQKWDNLCDRKVQKEGDELYSCCVKIAQKSREYIDYLWTIMHKYNDRFDPNVSLYNSENRQNNDYIGKILYHIPLSISVQHKIQDAIYKSRAWEFFDIRSFDNIIKLILNSIKDDKENEELRNILSVSNQSYDKRVLTEKLLSVIEDFDVEEYKKKLKERRRCNDNADASTIVSGEFAFGIKFPPINSDEEDISIVLLTTIKQELSFESKGEKIHIKNGKRYGSIAGYNFYPVEIDGFISLNSLKDYSIRKKNEFNITLLPYDDVIFFYEYDENLYIQTREIIKAPSFCIAVKKANKSKFENWCIDNSNSLEETDANLLGDDWVIYFSPNPLRGQYYDVDSTNNSESNDVSVVSRRGGIEKIKGQNVYFINAIPYFEIPENIDINQIKIYLNVDGREYCEYKSIIVGQKLIIDILGMPIASDENPDVDICLEYNGQKIYETSFLVMGQMINYNASCFYKYDSFGQKCSSEDYCFSGNFINTQFSSKRVGGLYSISKDKFDGIDDSFYFNNLLAACCYNSQTTEITYKEFEKIVTFAATRLDIDILQKDFFKKARTVLLQAGILNVDYYNRKYQAIPPSFMSVPFSNSQYTGTQLIMLCGCYSRAFIADLKDFCEENEVEVYIIRKNNEIKTEESLLPPIVLLGHNFRHNDFCSKYHHKYDVYDYNYDFATSMLKVIPEFSIIEGKFRFNQNDDLVSCLEQTDVIKFPRIRKCGEVYNRRWYIEQGNNNFAEFPVELLSWASIYCHRKIALPTIISNRDKVLILDSLVLPNYVQRALYLMNLGLPKRRKVFICDSKFDRYYFEMKEYQLYDNTRVETFISQFADQERLWVRNKVELPKYKCKYKMYLWVRVTKKQKETYLVLKNNSSIMAIVHKNSVYLYHESNRSLRRIVSNSHSMNQVMSFLITKSWMYGENGNAIGYSKDGGVGFERVYEISEETITIPTENNFKSTEIEIV